MKQTAVEWLENELKKIPFINPKEAFEQAKAMEKEQMIQSFRKGAVVHEPEYYTWIESAYRKQAEQYYKETFKQDQ
tara:strand:+ start:159 stop:386 length:228 start_codon:yes stop_codon:yes gene_type:complete